VSKNSKRFGQHRFTFLKTGRAGFVLVLMIAVFGQALSAFPWQKKKKVDAELSYLEWAVKAADSFISRNPDFRITYEEDRDRHKWHYEQGLMANALYQLYLQTEDQKYYDFIVKNIDQFVDGEGNIKTYKQHSYKLDDIGSGRILLRLYKDTDNPKYKKAADQLRQQLEDQPCTAESGFWHKKIYPYQMWLDGLYMAAPFYAEYALMFDQSENLDDVLKQFQLIEKHNYDAESGLYHHGWDEKKVQIWANPETGLSSNYWGRSLGWYEMALVDVLELLPEDHPGKGKLSSQLQKLSAALLNYRDPQSSVWYQVLNQGDRAGNYLEASTSVMFVYAFAKGANQGFLDRDFYVQAQQSFVGVLKEFITTNDAGLLDIHHVCSVAGLGGKNQRDGSFEYYIGEPQRTNDYKALCPFILAAIELERGK